MIGVLTLTQYGHWRHTHAIHHATCGNLCRRGIGDVATLTVREYCALSRWGQLKYRLYRHPLVMFGLGPVYLFFLQNRLPLGLMRAGWRPWASTMATNLAIASIAVALAWLIGTKGGAPCAHSDRATRRYDRRLAVLCPTPVRAYGLGPQMQSGIYTTRPCTAVRITICPRRSAGSRPISACITSIISAAAFHITGCRRCCVTIRSSADSIGRLTLLESFRCVPLALWDETQRHLVTFREAEASC